MVGKLQADSGSEDNSSITLDNSSPKKEVTEAPSTSAWDRPAPVSVSYHHCRHFLIFTKMLSNFLKMM
jgi:hypothetical protein